jgi:hypothetical protein
MTNPTLSDLMAAALLESRGELVKAIEHTADGKMHVRFDTIVYERSPLNESICIVFKFCGQPVWSFEAVTLAPGSNFTLTGIPGRMEVSVS